MRELFQHTNDDDLRSLLIKILKNQEIQMAQYDDLVAALTALQTDVADLATRVAAVPAATPTDLTAPLQTVAAIDTQVKAIDAPVVTPPVPPAPAA